MSVRGPAAVGFGRKKNARLARASCRAVAGSGMWNVGVETESGRYASLMTRSTGGWGSQDVGGAGGTPADAMPLKKNEMTESQVAALMVSPIP